MRIPALIVRMKRKDAVFTPDFAIQIKCVVEVADETARLLVTTNARVVRNSNKAHLIIVWNNGESAICRRCVGFVIAILLPTGLIRGGKCRRGEKCPDQFF